MDRVWKPERIVSDFETSLIPALAAEVDCPGNSWEKDPFILRFSFLTPYIRGAIFTISRLYIGVFRVWVSARLTLRTRRSAATVAD